MNKSVNSRRASIGALQQKPTVSKGAGFGSINRHISKGKFASARFNKTAKNTPFSNKSLFSRKARHAKPSFHHPKKQVSTQQTSNYKDEISALKKEGKIDESKLNELLEKHSNDHEFLKEVLNTKDISLSNDGRKELCEAYVKTLFKEGDSFDAFDSGKLSLNEKFEALNEVKIPKDFKCSPETTSMVEDCIAKSVNNFFEKSNDLRQELNDKKAEAFKQHKITHNNPETKETSFLNERIKFYEKFSFVGDKNLSQLGIGETGKQAILEKTLFHGTSQKSSDLTSDALGLNKPGGDDKRNLLAYYTKTCILDNVNLSNEGKILNKNTNEAKFLSQFLNMTFGDIVQGNCTTEQASGSRLARNPKAKSDAYVTVLPELKQLLANNVDFDTPQTGSLINDNLSNVFIKLNSFPKSEMRDFNLKRNDRTSVQSPMIQDGNLFLNILPKINLNDLSYRQLVILNDGIDSMSKDDLSMKPEQKLAFKKALYKTRIIYKKENPLESKDYKDNISSEIMKDADTLEGLIDKADFLMLGVQNGSYKSMVKLSNILLQEEIKPQNERQISPEKAAEYRSQIKNTSKAFKFFMFFRAGLDRFMLSSVDKSEIEDKDKNSSQ